MNNLDELKVRKKELGQKINEILQEQSALVKKRLLLEIELAEVKEQIRNRQNHEKRKATNSNIRSA